MDPMANLLLSIIIGTPIIVALYIGSTKIDRWYTDRQKRLGRVDWPLR